MSDPLSSTLSELEGDDWGESPPDAPPFLAKCFALRHVKLADLDAEGLRLLIGQNIGLKYLMPLAVRMLRANPLIAGRHYPGDLLSMVLSADRAYYQTQPLMRSAVEQLLQHARRILPELDEIDREYAAESLNEAAREFDGS